MAGYGFHRDIANSELDIQVAGSIVFSASSTAVTIGAGATSGLTVVAGGLTVTAGGLAITAGGLDIVSPLTMFGYATGAGATPTVQQTNKQTTIVTNTPCGVLQTHNEALAGEAESTFQVTNSTVAVNDVVVVSIKSGGTSGEYHAWVSLVTSGTFKITIANLTAGSLSDNVFINFAVISAVAA